MGYLYVFSDSLRSNAFRYYNEITLNGKPNENLGRRFAVRLGYIFHNIVIQQVGIIAYFPT